MTFEKARGDIPESVQADLGSVWVCESHPWAEMGHDDCGGAGVPWNTAMLMAMQFAKHAYYRLEHVMRDAGVDCCLGECVPGCLNRQLREFLGIGDS